MAVKSILCSRSVPSAPSPAAEVLCRGRFQRAFPVTRSRAAAPVATPVLPVPLWGAGTCVTLLLEAVAVPIVWLLRRVLYSSLGLEQCFGVGFEHEQLLQMVPSPYCRDF